MMKFSLKPVQPSGRTLLAASAFLAGSLFAFPAMACTLENWSSHSGAIDAAGPPGVARYSGVCAAQVAGGSATWVQDNRPGGIDRIVARFYVLNDLSSGTVHVYAGYPNTSGTSQRFRVQLSANGNVTLRDNVTTQVISQDGGSGKKWHSIEIDWAQGAGTGSISLSVNGQAPVTQNGLSNVGNPLQSVRLGNINGAGSGFLNFDAYESRRTTAVGRLVLGDANADGNINSLDVIAIRNEILLNGLASGQPDCNENGSINSLDVICVRNIILGN